MSEQTSYRCDICGIEKQESNHWWKGYLLQGETEKLGRSNLIMIVPWNQVSIGLATEHTYITFPWKIDAHLCGESHAIEWASKNLSKR